MDKGLDKDWMVKVVKWIGKAEGKGGQRIEELTWDFEGCGLRKYGWLRIGCDRI